MTAPHNFDAYGGKPERKRLGKILYIVDNSAMPQ